MTEQMVVDLIRQFGQTLILLAAPILLSGLVVGVMISIFQVATSINDQTLTFVPKMVVMLGVITLGFPWMLDIITRFTISLFSQLSLYAR